MPTMVSCRPVISGSGGENQTRRVSRKFGIPQNAMLAETLSPIMGRDELRPLIVSQQWPTGLVFSHLVLLELHLSDLGTK